MCLTWVIHKLRGTSGREQCRNEIANMLKLPHAKVESKDEKMMGFSRSQPEVPVPRVLETEDDGFEVKERVHDHAFRRAEQVVKTIKKFDGIDADEYIKWRYTLMNVIDNSFIGEDSWTRYYCILASMENTLLTWARSIPNKGSADGAIVALWNNLDMRFLTVQTIGRFEKEFSNIKQTPTETVEGFTSRFLRMVEMRNQVFGSRLSDLELKSKFSNALTHPNLAWVKAIADGTANDFESYARIIISYDKNMPRQPMMTAPLNAIKVNMKCYRCNVAGHTAAQCRSTTIFNADKRCQRCGTTNHLNGCQQPLTCKRCGRAGHIAGVCRANPKHVQQGDVHDEKSDKVIGDLVVQNNTITIHAAMSNVTLGLGTTCEEVVDLQPLT